MLNVTSFRKVLKLTCNCIIYQIIANDISELQKNQATTVAKIAQYKRKLMDLSHRVLQVRFTAQLPTHPGFDLLGILSRGYNVQTWLYLNTLKAKPGKEF